MNPPAETEETTLPMDKLKELAEQITYHQEQKALHEARIAELTAEVRNTLKTPVRGIKAGSVMIDWAPPKRVFDAPRFISMYPPDTNPTLYKQVPNSDMIPKSLKDQFMVYGKGEGTVTIK